MIGNSYHFIGIGGVGMSALAHIILDLGGEVTGSDLSRSPVIEELEKRGALIFPSQASGQVKEGQIVIYTSMVSEANIEWKEAKEMGCLILHRSELLHSLMKGKKAVIIAGAHGKTTTTALLSFVLAHAGKRPSYVVGGFLSNLPRNGKFDDGEYFIAEGDESDGSFLRTDPFGAIVTNIDFDHLDYWKTKEALLEGYERFIDRVQHKEFFLYSSEDLYIKMNGGVSFGFSNGADLQAFNIGFHQDRMEFDVSFRGKLYEKIKLKILGHHNVTNALGVFGMSLLLGVEETDIREAFKIFSGVKRRLEYKGSKNGIFVYDDYAHHPKEIEAAIKAFQMMKGDRRLVVIFQAHRYSRSKEFLAEFMEVLSSLSLLIVTDIYPAGEKETEEMNTAIFCKGLLQNRGFHYVERGRLTSFLVDFVKEGDLVVTLGAGDVTRVSEELLTEIARCDYQKCR